MVKRDWKLITLMFVLFFLTIFFHGCSTTRSDPTLGPPPEFSVGFPFAYTEPVESIRLQNISIIWWALCLNLVVFFLIYKYLHIISENILFKLYTYILIWIHMLFGLSTKLVFSNTLDILNILFANILFGYLFTFGIIGRILTSFIPVLGAGQATFIVLWLPLFIYVLYKKKKNKSNDNSANNHEKKRPLKKKAP
jgi:hypothetical protein